MGVGEQYVAWVFTQWYSAYTVTSAGRALQRDEPYIHTSNSVPHVHGFEGLDSKYSNCDGNMVSRLAERNSRMRALLTLRQH